MESGEEHIKCIGCNDAPRDAVLLQCHMEKSQGGGRNKVCKPFFCGTSVRGRPSCVNQYLSHSAREKRYPIAKWSQSEARLEFLDDRTPESNWKIAVCPLCRGDIRGAEALPAYRAYFNSLKTECPFDGCEFGGDHLSMKAHLAEVHQSGFEREYNWEV